MRSLELSASLSSTTWIVWLRRIGFHRPWGPFNYVEPVRDVARITELRGNEAVFLETMVAMSLPFIWVGVVLTLKRLRSAGLPPPLVILFFVPLVNLFFFVFLSLIPSRGSFGDGSKYEREGMEGLAAGANTFLRARWAVPPWRCW